LFQLWEKWTQGKRLQIQATDDEKRFSEPKASTTSNTSESHKAESSEAKNSSGADSQTRRNNSKKKSGSNKTAYATTVSVDSNSGYPDIYGFPSHLCIDVLSASTECDDTK
jgi:hypothetical protein